MLDYAKLGENWLISFLVRTTRVPAYFTDPLVRTCRRVANKQDMLEDGVRYRLSIRRPPESSAIEGAIQRRR
jgi:hypothetical protein